MTPSTLLYTIWSSSRHLAYYEQQDAHELMIALLDTLCEHLSSNHGDFNIASVVEPASAPVESVADFSSSADGESSMAESKESIDKDNTQDIFHFRGIVNEV